MGTGTFGGVVTIDTSTADALVLQDTVDGLGSVDMHMVWKNNTGTVMYRLGADPTYQRFEVECTTAG